MSPTRRHEPQPCHQLCDEDAEKLSLTSVNKRTEYLEGKGWEKITMIHCLLSFYFPHNLKDDQSGQVIIICKFFPSSALTSYPTSFVSFSSYWNIGPEPWKTKPTFKDYIEIENCKIPCLSIDKTYLIKPKFTTFMQKAHWWSNIWKWIILILDIWRMGNHIWIIFYARRRRRINTKVFQLVKDDQNCHPFSFLLIFTLSNGNVFIGKGSFKN